MRVEQSCDGWTAHNNGPVGESLIGWYKTEREARDALRPWKKHYEMMVPETGWEPLVSILTHIQIVALIQESLDVKSANSGRSGESGMLGSEVPLQK